MAIGLIGHGSQAISFDDEVSRDHDWGPQFCVFLDQKDFEVHGGKVQIFLEALPAEFDGFKVEWDARQPKERSGVLQTQAWFYEQLGVEAPFKDNTDWLKTSDPRLLWVTNGEIWHDPLGHVSKLRKNLAYYPDEVWLARVVNKCMLVRILGPYQISRALERGERLLPFLSRSYFVREVLHLVFLLNRRYAPFHKWLPRSFELLPDQLGLSTELIEGVLCEPNAETLLERVQDVEDRLHTSVQLRFLNVKETENMLQFGFKLSERIGDPKIREMQFWNQELVV